MLFLPESIKKQDTYFLNQYHKQRVKETIYCNSETYFYRNTIRILGHFGIDINVFLFPG